MNGVIESHEETYIENLNKFRTARQEISEVSSYLEDQNIDISLLNSHTSNYDTLLTSMDDSQSKFRELAEAGLVQFCAEEIDDFSVIVDDLQNQVDFDNQLVVELRKSLEQDIIAEIKNIRDLVLDE